MAVITISVTNAGPELLSGVPQWVSLETNIPATIFYTTDGTAPTVLSSVYVTSISLTTSSSIRLRALAVSGSDTGTLNVLFTQDTSAITYPRRQDATYGAGLVVDAYSMANVFNDGYGLDQFGASIVPVRYVDNDAPNLDYKLSGTNATGDGPGLYLKIGIASNVKDISFERSSPNNNNAFFNPRALYVVIDGRDGYEDQIHDGYMIINRPNAGTTDPVRYLNGRMFYEPHPYVTGGFVKTFYNSNRRLSTSYYFDANECRWIKSIQNFDPSQVPANLGLRSSFGGPLVFKWVYNKRSMI